MLDADLKEIKYLASRLYALCNENWPDEFISMYRARPEIFRDWLNGKTGLTVDHITDRHEALSQWINALEHIVR